MKLNRTQKDRLAQSGQGFSPTAKAERAAVLQTPVAQSDVAPIGHGVGAMLAGLELAEENAADALATRLEQSPDRIMQLAAQKLAARGWNPESSFRQWGAEFDQIPAAVTGRASYPALAAAIDVTP